jgi:hypothetical protein
MPRRLVLCLAVWLLALLPGVGWAAPIGTVTRLKGEAAAGALALSPGTTIPAGAILRTAAGARVEIRFIDGTELVLGELAELVVDQFEFDGKAQTGKAVLDVRAGAFLVGSGAIGKLPDRPLRVVTPVATIGIRGTKFWGGSLRNPLDVLVLDGAIRVESAAGAVILDQPGQGTSVPRAGMAPVPPSFWGPEQVDQAFKSVSFD